MPLLIALAIVVGLVAFVPDRAVPSRPLATVAPVADAERVRAEARLVTVTPTSAPAQGEEVEPAQPPAREGNGAAPSSLRTARVFPPSTSARPIAGDVTLPAFDGAIGSLLSQGYPGGSLAVVRNGKLVYARGYGMAREGVPATATTRYRQASVSKPVTGSLLKTLVAKGTLSTDLRVFPYLGVSPADPRANRITVGMLRDHTSGLGGDFFFESREAASYYRVASPPDVDTMVRWTARYPLVAEPGTTYSYSNTNYALLSRVMERATGRAWIDLVTDMGRPLQIRSWRLGTSLGQPADEARYREADAWRYGPSVFDSIPGNVEWPYGAYHLESFNGAVALVSTVVDMARYDLAVATGAVPAPEAKPIPTTAGSSYTYVYNGSMPGHYSSVIRVWDGVNLTVIASAFNHRDAGPIDDSINGRLMDAYRATAAWPSVDLFGQY